MNRSAWRAYCALLFILSDTGSAWAVPPQSKPLPLTAAELRRAEQLCADLVGVPIGKIEYSQGTTKCAQLRPLLPYMADAQGGHVATCGLDGSWQGLFALRGGMEVSLFAQWYDKETPTRQTPADHAPVVRVEVSRKDGKVIFMAFRKNST